MLSDEARAAKLAVVEQFDGFAPLRNGVARLAAERSEWAGIPMPLEGQRLVIEPRYPRAEELSRLSVAEPDEHEEYRDTKIVNSFWSMARSSEIVIFEKADGSRDWGIVPGVHSVTQQLETLRSADAWGIRQESAAINTLGTLLRHRQFKQYLLTGMFMEQSQRSGVHYIFRKLRPTIAATTRQKAGGEGPLRILAALCLHPIGYYSGSWAGAMCPTDDVIAHLVLMRGDEHMLWRRANQHPAYRPEAGL